MIPISSQQTTYGARLPRPTIANLVWWFDWTDVTLVSNSTSALVPAADGDDVKRVYMVQDNSAAMTGTVSRYGKYRYNRNGKGSYAEYDGATQHCVRMPTAQVDQPFSVCMAFNSYLAGTGIGSPTIFNQTGLFFRRSAAANADYQIGSTTYATANTDAYRAGKVSAIIYYNMDSSYMRINGTTYNVTLTTNRGFNTGSNVFYFATGTEINNSRIDMYSFLVATGELSDTEKTNWDNWASQQLGGLA